MRVKALSFGLALLLGGTLSAAPKRKCASPASVSYALSAQHQARVAGDAPSATLKIVGNIAVLEADPELLILSNPFDLKNRAIHYEPVLRNRYIYALTVIPFDGTASDTIGLKDDDSAELIFKYFQFPFAGKPYDRCYINSNGSVTFTIGDTDPPDFDTLVNGPPRIAPFFADLDPETSGTIFVRQTQDFVTISWLKVPEFYNHDQFDYGQNTFQAVLHRNGSIDLVYSEEMTASQALVGILPGFGKSVLRSIDFSTQNSSRPQSAFIENFHDYESVDLPVLMQALYRQMPDNFDFVSLFSNFDLIPIPGVQAFAVNVQNDVQGIGDPSGKGKTIFHENKKYGSARSLQTITFFGNLHQYPSNPFEALPDTSTSLLQIIAHETGHRWLSYVRILRDGRNSVELLGRDRNHWSFFLNTAGSYLEGNQIQQKSSNSFVTSTPFARYSDLDLYLMGLLPADQVQDTYYVDSPNSFSPGYNFSPESTPEADVRFKGAAIPVRITDVVAANGARKPDPNSSQKDFRDLFVLITKKDTPATNEEIRYLDLVRTSWEEFFSESTGQEGTISTSLP